MKKYKHIQLTLIVSLLLLTISFPLLAKVTAKVDREYAYEGETITLSIRAEDNNQSGTPDFSPLTKDFDLAGTSQSSQISIINGHRSDSQTWSIRLQPKKMGQIKIPPIEFGGEKTEAINIEIKSIPVQSGAHQGEPLFLTLEISSEAKRFYVQQHIPITARLYFKHEISQGQISDPQPKDALLEKLGEDSSYTTRYNDQEYTVYERHYSLFAERSGDLVIPAVSFTGYMENPNSHLKNRRTNDPFSQFFSQSPLRIRGQPVSIKSKSITLNIEPHPEDFTGTQWLPAEALQLKDSWSEKPPEFITGEPITRTITLEAKGLVASQIKPLELPKISSFRRYSEPPETETRTDGENVYAKSIRTFTYIPTFAGEQVIPEVKLTWWNVLTQKQEESVLPPWKINVENSLDTIEPLPLDPIISQVDDGAKNISPIETEPPETSSNILVRFRSFFDQFSYWIFAGLAIFFSFILIMSNKQKKTPEVVSQKPDTTRDNGIDKNKINIKTSSKELLIKRKIYLDDLKKSCQDNNAQETAQILLKVASTYWDNNPPRSLGSLADKVTQGHELLKALDQQLYSGNKNDWQGSVIYEQFKNGFNLAKDQIKEEPYLKPLYPQP